MKRETIRRVRQIGVRYDVVSIRITACAPIWKSAIARVTFEPTTTSGERRLRSVPCDRNGARAWPLTANGGNARLRNYGRSVKTREAVFTRTWQKAASQIGYTNLEKRKYFQRLYTLTRKTRNWYYYKPVAYLVEIIDVRIIDVRRIEKVQREIETGITESDNFQIRWVWNLAIIFPNISIISFVWQYIKYKYLRVHLWQCVSLNNRK